MNHFIKIPARWLLLITIMPAIFLFSCKKKDLDSYGQGDGTIQFSTDMDGENISLYVNGELWGRLDSAHQNNNSQLPGTMISRSAPYGLYNFEAYTQDSFRHWKGQAVVLEGDTQKIRLTDLSPTLVDGLDGLARVTPGFDSVMTIYTKAETFDLGTNSNYATDTIKLTYNKKVLAENERFNTAMSWPGLTGLALERGRNEINWETTNAAFSTGRRLSFNLKLSDYTSYYDSRLVKPGGKLQLVIIRY